MDTRHGAGHTPVQALGNLESGDPDPVTTKNEQQLSGLKNLTFIDPHQVIEGFAETATSKKMEDLNNSEVFANSSVQVQIPC